MDIDQILDQLIHYSEDIDRKKQELTEYQADIRMLICATKMWFMLHEKELPEVK